MLLDFGKDAIRVAAGDAVNGLLVILSQHGEREHGRDGEWPIRLRRGRTENGPSRGSGSDGGASSAGSQGGFPVPVIGN